MRLINTEHIHINNYCNGLINKDIKFSSTNPQASISNIVFI